MAKETIYLTVDSERSNWDAEAGLLTVDVNFPFFLTDFYKNQWYVSLIDYRPPLVDASSPGFAYIFCDFIENQYLNGVIGRNLAVVQVAKSELQRSYIAAPIKFPVPCLVTVNPISKLTLNFLSPSVERPIKFLGGDFFLLFKFEILK